MGETIPIVAKAVNTAIVLLLAFGIWKRHRPGVHIPVMLACFLVDVVNVAIVELYARSKGKGAIEQAGEAIQGEVSGLLTFHIAVSALCLVGYVVAAISGWRLHRRSTGRAFHRANAVVFILTRLSSYVTSFMV